MHLYFFKIHLKEVKCVSVCHPCLMVPGTWLSGTPDVFLTTCLHHPVMVHHSNKYELEHLQFPFFS